MYSSEYKNVFFNIDFQILYLVNIYVIFLILKISINVAYLLNQFEIVYQSIKNRL